MNSSKKRLIFFNACSSLFVALSCGVIVVVVALVTRAFPQSFTEKLYLSEYRVAWNPKSSILAASSDAVQLYTNVLEKTRVFSSKSGADDVLSLSWSPDGNRLVGSSRNGIIQIWDPMANQPIAQTTGYAAYSVAWSPDGAYIAGGKTTDNVEIWDARTLKSIATFVGHQGDVRTVAWNSDGNTIASGSDDQTVRLWQVKTGKCLLTIQTTSEVSSVRFSPDGKFLAAGLFTGNLLIWKVPEGNLQRVISSGTGVYGAHIVAWSPDGATILSTDNNTVKLWDFITGINTRTWKASERLIQGGAWSPDGNEIVTVDADGSMAIWKTATGELLAQHKLD